MAQVHQPRDPEAASWPESCSYCWSRYASPDNFVEAFLVAKDPTRTKAARSQRDRRRKVPMYS